MAESGIDARSSMFHHVLRGAGRIAAQRGRGSEPTNEDVFEAAATLAGAGDSTSQGGTVESIATCYTIDGKRIPGVTGDDAPKERTDEFAKTREQRHEAAENRVDEAEAWLRANDPHYKKPQTFYRSSGGRRGK